MPNLTVMCSNVSAVLVKMVDDLLVQWERETIHAIQKASADSEIDGLSELVELGALAIKPLAQELRVLLLRQAETYINQAAKKIGYRLHKEMAIARKKVNGTADEVAALIPIDSVATTASGIGLLQDELAALLKKVRNDLLKKVSNDLQSKLDSKISGRVLHLGSKLFNHVTEGGQQLNQLQKEADSFEQRLREKLKKDSKVDIVKYLPESKLGELVKSDRVQGILERETSYSTSTGGRFNRLCTMVGRTLGRSRAELTKHENELGEHT